VSATSIARLACQPVPVTTTVPRAASVRSTPTSASAARRPGSALSAGRPCTWTLRTRAAWPAGSTVTLADRISENGTQFVGTTFDSEAFTRMTNAGKRPLSGRFHPEGSLDRTFRGTEAGGIWKLRVIDEVAGDRGTLNWWSLEIATPYSRSDGADAISGGQGLHDLVDYSARTGSVSVSLDGSAGDGLVGEGDDARAGLEEAVAGSGDDTLDGNASGNDLRGWTGDDEVSGGDGDDVIDGGDGFDTLDGNAGTNMCLNGEAVANCDVV